jgi:1,4-alpha-glucan branching enzyme
MNKTKKSPAKAAAPAKASKSKAQNTPKTAPKAAPESIPAPGPVVRLQLAAAGARSVAVAGSFNSWQPEPATQTGDGAWVKEISVTPGRYEYLFVVDGQWQPDPNAREQVPNPFGGQNSVLVIGQ